MAGVVLGLVVLLLGLGLLGASYLSPEPEVIRGWADLLTRWNYDPDVWLLSLLAVLVYRRGVNSRPRPSHPVGPWRQASFYAGVAVVFLALESPLDTLADYSFLVHQVQHVLLRMVGPALILLGAPLTPLLRGLPRPVLKGVVAPLVSDPWMRALYNFLTRPSVALVLFLGTLYLWQVPGPHNASVRSDLVHYAMHTSMLVGALLFWWVVIDPRPHRSPLGFGRRVLFIALATPPNTLLGAVIAFSRRMLYDAYDYGAIRPFWSLSPLYDQQAGALVLWIAGDMMMALALVVVMAVWFRREEAGAPSYEEAPAPGTQGLG